MTSNMVTNKNVCKIQQSVLYFTFLLSQFIDTLVQHLLTFFDALSTTFMISRHKITELSAILFKYLQISQTHALGLQL